MTSKIVVNNIESDAGVSTVFFNSDIGATDGTLNVDGNLTVDGVITYEDVTNVDSVGIVTAQAGIRVTGGSVGIGTELPTSPLAVMSSSDPEIRFGYNETQDHRITWDSSKVFLEADPDNANGSSALGFRVDGTEALRIDSDGKVGIGTDNPNYQTTIAADGANAKLNIKRKTAAASNGNAFGSLFYTNSDGTDVASIRAHRESANDDAYLGFATRNTGGSITERVRVDSAGNVGINETTPDSKIDIVYHTSENSATANLIHLRADPGGSYVTRGLFVKIGRDGNYDNSAVRYDIVGSSGNSGFHAFEVQGNEKLRITKDGKVGIGTDNPDELLEVGDGTVSGALKVSGQSSSVTSDGFTVDWESSSNSTRFFSEPSSGASSAIRFFTTPSSGTRAERLRITGIGSVGIGHADPYNRLHVKDTGANISATGDAILNSTQKGIRVENGTNDDSSLGLWFSTGSHHSGISGQRNDYANTWGTDLRFYTHEDATNDLTYTRERHRINPNGLLINRKGNNAVNTGGNILGRYKYTQGNQGSGYGHLILGADGRKLQDYVTTNCYCIITVTVTGTGTNNMFCQYYYHAISSAASVNLTHMYGNNGASSNRPYMELVNTSDPVWKMSHNGGYTLDIEVAIYGGATGFTYTTEFGNFTTNP